MRARPAMIMTRRLRHPSTQAPAGKPTIRKASVCKAESIPIWVSLARRTLIAIAEVASVPTWKPTCAAVCPAHRCMNAELRVSGWWNQALTVTVICRRRGLGRAGCPVDEPSGGQSPGEAVVANRGGDNIGNLNQSLAPVPNTDADSGTCHGLDIIVRVANSHST